MKKITYIITRSDAFGGANIHLLDLIPLVAHKYEVELLIGGQGVVYKRALDLGIPTYSIPDLVREIDIKRDYLAYKQIVQHLKASKPDLIHLHSSKAGVLGRLAAKKCNIPAIFTAHGWAFTEGVSPLKRFTYKYIERFSAPLAHRIITVSDYDRNLALLNKVASKEKIVTIHNGIYQTPHYDVHDRTNALCRLIMVARFEQPKDQAFLIEALSTLKALNWHLTLIGDGPTLEPARKLAKRHNLAHRIHFTGHRNDVAQQLIEADLFLLISNWEGFPLSILEAMRARLPVIASKVGGIPEAVVDGKTGYLIPRGDIKELVRKLQLLISQPDLRYRLGKSGEERFQKLFTIDIMAEQTTKIYEEAIASFCR